MRLYITIFILCSVTSQSHGKLSAQFLIDFCHEKDRSFMNFFGLPNDHALSFFKSLSGISRYCNFSFCCNPWSECIRQNSIVLTNNFMQTKYRVGIWKFPPWANFYKMKYLRKISISIHFLDFIPDNRHN